MEISGEPTVADVRVVIDALDEAKRAASSGISLPKQYPINLSCLSPRLLQSLNSLMPVVGVDTAVLYVLAAYCAHRDDLQPQTIRDRDEWRQLHARLCGLMRRRRRGTPSKQLHWAFRLSLKYNYGWLRDELPRLRSPSQKSVAAVFHRMFDGWQPNRAHLDDVLTDLSFKSHRRWKGLQAALGEYAGISPSEFRKRVVEVSEGKLGVSRMNFAERVKQFSIDGQPPSV